ncbi:MAG: 1-acyl-sn-glycerol-3-phosphate acyltransferase [Tannerella sp.]|jgi:1-acyl-sn-glycerol-3-phosphate acyltransferase|nr:1-acyl-sn-glycerol-3-phosphate acyltransferase [Tannerella sp.]
MVEKEKSRQGLIYRSFRAYLRLVHERFFYRKVYCTGKENIPPDGVSVLIVSNHQNCLNDPLGVLFTFKDRKLNVLTRADVFAVHPVINILLRKMGLLPAYRLDFEGEESLGKNKEIFYVSEKELISGRTILMYPESGHQDKRWLGDFSLGYTKMAFEAAELDDFRMEIFILPSCNHYSDYFDIQKDMLIKFGTPISIKPYYELYKSKPRTAQRRVNALVREQITAMMLNITDLDNYRAIDFLRNTYGRKYAAEHGYRAGYLPEKLLSDRVLFEALDEAKSKDEAFVQQIYDDALRLEGELEKLNIRDEQFDGLPGWGMIAVTVAALLILFPVWLFALWPNIIVYRTPEFVTRRMDDKMFRNSFLFGMSVLITIPLLYILSFVLVWIYVNVAFAAIYVLILPYLGLFAWYYWKNVVRTLQDIRFRRAATGSDISETGAVDAKGEPAEIGKISELRGLRTMIYKRLNKILK